MLVKEMKKAIRSIGKLIAGVQSNPLLLNENIETLIKASTIYKNIATKIQAVGDLKGQIKSLNQTLIQQHDTTTNLMREYLTKKVEIAKAEEAAQAISKKEHQAKFTPIAKEAAQKAVKFTTKVTVEKEAKTETNTKAFSKNVFNGIHKSLRRAVSSMSDVLDALEPDELYPQVGIEEINYLKHQIDSLLRVIDLAEQTMTYVRENKPRAEKNPEGLADKLAHQKEHAIQCLHDLKIKLKGAQIEFEQKRKPKTFHQLENGQMIITFADLEGDLPFLERSLGLYKKAYEDAYSDQYLDPDDFTITYIGNGEEYIKIPDNVICVNIGDLTDKTRNSNKDRKECYNLRLATIFSNTHDVYANRMISILGNRETTKFRLKNELNIEFIQKVLREELSLNEEERKKTGAARDSKLVWVDGPAKTFLSYLKSLPEYALYGDEALALKLETMALDNVAKLKIMYAKWMLANSCGAPDLWNDIATEAETQNDEETLTVLQDFFCNEKGKYANYLRHCQLGAQVGNLLFTHGGLEDNSFILPKSLLKILSDAELKEVFGPQATTNNIPENTNGQIIAKDINQLLLALNLWYSRITTLHFNNSIDNALQEALTDLIAMGLPRPRHNGASLINVAFTDSKGAYGNPLSQESYEKLIHSGTGESVHTLYHGHMPAERPRVGVTNISEDGTTVLHHIDGDTCNYRQEKAAVATVIRKEDNSTLIALHRIDNTIKAQHHCVEIPAIDKKGKLSNYTVTPNVFLGLPISLDETNEGKGWNIMDYDEEEDSYVLFKQNGFIKDHPLSFKPETKTVSAHDIRLLLEQQEEERVLKQLEESIKLTPEDLEKLEANRKLQAAIDLSLTGKKTEQDIEFGAPQGASTSPSNKSLPGTQEIHSLAAKRLEDLNERDKKGKSSKKLEENNGVTAEDLENIEAERERQAAIDLSLARNNVSRNRREKKINQALTKVNEVIEILQAKIHSLDINLPGVHSVAMELLDSLKGYRDIYAKNLNEGVDIQQAGKAFKYHCEIAINRAIPILERDLGWGEFLKNVLKSIGNAVVTIITFGNKTNFFSYTKSEASRAATEAKEDLGLNNNQSPN